MVGDESCCSLFSIEFNSVLANLYRDGQDCMGFHSDDEKEVGWEPVIASVTLGGCRNFDLMHKKQPYKLRLRLQPGSMLVMKVLMVMRLNNLENKILNFGRM